MSAPLSSVTVWGKGVPVVLKATPYTPKPLSQKRLRYTQLDELGQPLQDPPKSHFLSF